MTQLAGSFAATILTLVSFLGRATPAWLIGIAFFFSITKAFVLPAQQALVPNLVPEQDLQAAVALNAITFNLARAIGPVIGAGVILTLGFTWAFAINALSYLALAGVVMIIRVPTRTRRMRSERTTLWETLRMVRKDPVVGPLLLVIAVVGIATDPVSNLTPGFAVQIYGRSDTFAGILIAAFGLGAALTAALVVMRFRATSRGIAGGMVGLGLAIVTFGLSSNATVGLVALFVGGIMYICTGLVCSAETSSR